MTVGVTINQGANDDEILALKSSDVAHGVTTDFETDSYGVFKKANAANGGMQLTGLEDTGGASIALDMLGILAASGDTTKTATSKGAIRIVGHVKSGTSFGDMGPNENILVVASGGATVRFILDADGDSHQDVGTAWTNFDEYDDLDMLRSLAVNVSRNDDLIRRQFGQFLEDKRPLLERAKLVTFNEDGHHFVNMSKLTMLLTGAAWQLGEQLKEEQARFQALERRLTAIGV